MSLKDDLRKFLELFPLFKPILVIASVLTVVLIVTIRLKNTTSINTFYSISKDNYHDVSGTVLNFNKNDCLEYLNSVETPSYVKKTIATSNDWLTTVIVVKFSADYSQLNYLFNTDLNKYNDAKQVLLDKKLIIE